MADFSLEILQQKIVLLADGVDEARDEEIARRTGAGKEVGDKVAGAAVLPFMEREARRVEESPAALAAVEQIFLVKPLEGGHDRSVGERAAYVREDATHAALPRLPENLHDFDFETAERKWARSYVIGTESGFEESDHADAYSRAPEAEAMAGNEEPTTCIHLG